MLADALGVTGQAVSRWEAGGSYPDMELVPAIANYFGITIDELFGYRSERDIKVNAVIERIDSYHIESDGDDWWVDECIAILREALAEFPANETLLLKLADVLFESGWRRHHEHLEYDDEGYICHDYDLEQKNEYWIEAAKIYENLASESKDNAIVNKSVKQLVGLYRNFGDETKAVSCSNRMPEMKNSREVLLAYAVDGKKEAEYIGDLLLKMADKFAEQIVYGLVNNLSHYESDMPIEKLKGAIGIFHLICDDGNFGEYNNIIIQLYLYLSRIQWERGYHDDAFDSLDKALEHAKALEAVRDGYEHSYTAPLVKFVKFKDTGKPDVAVHLPEDWPMWCNPDYDDVEKEIKSDPRWDEWVKKTGQ